MVTIGNTELKTPGMYWYFKFTDEELKKRTCAICKTAMEIGQQIYACEECKSLCHADCFMAYVQARKYHCFHSLKEEWQYFFGSVVKDG
jgi:hypothetical protein